MLNVSTENLDRMVEQGIARIYAADYHNAKNILQSVVAQNPGHTNGLFYWAICCYLMRQYDVAEQAFDRVLQVSPNFADALSNRGLTRQELGRVSEAIADYQRVLQIDPSNNGARANLILALLFHPNSEQILLQIVREWCTQTRLQFPPIRHERPQASEAERPLRIGYVSCDFWRHSVANFFIPLLEHHDRRRFRIACFPVSPWRDDFSERIRRGADAWIDLAPLTEADCVKALVAEKLDILVDLSGFTGNSRPILYCYKPAPIQATYLGFAGTTGIPAIDYRLTDALADPPGMTEHLFSERLIRLPHTAWCFDPLEQPEPVQPGPLEQGGPPTFGSFNHLPKITNMTLDLWIQILNTLPHSRMVIKSRATACAGVPERVLGYFTSRGIAPSRVEILPTQGIVSEHRMMYRTMDIALDTFPYHGTTTTIESLWMGVPVITLAGRTHVSRVGVSLLNNVGLGDCVAETPEQYVQKAVNLARDRQRLMELRRALRPRLQASPIMDPKAHTANIEGAFREMWRAWCTAS